ncbi:MULTISPECIES: hypothetical protein [Halomicrobium]|uniref:Uncharacterized protein n=2 Tax=Halomicrobium mukohataei TaxID=57705 RepID=C7NXT9_HALMD|nr:MULTISPECIES: hypothetical protein [Halomicrobium]ACV46527.1 conserved hypothetical protein [Halomicrobium mukohataei DSM 12286]QCD65070.1 hypothetical protein E5139_05235 [Halomicrobium mukohataei]QFR19876.1 hypothetical protein GBQ70_05230 [Halomicrobium sp. ZPS1]
MSHSVDRSELTDTERAALHRLQLGVEHVHRGYGSLLACHHSIGHGMDHFEAARELLSEAGHEAYAEALREEILPAGFVDDRWTYELVDAARTGFVDDVATLEAAIRADLADGEQHVSERRLQRRWRRRAAGRDGE